MRIMWLGREIVVAGLPFVYRFDTVLYQFPGKRTSDRTKVCLDQILK